MARLDESYGYCFDLRKPDGVRLLGRAVFDRLQERVNTSAKQTYVPDHIDNILIGHGLLPGSVIEAPSGDVQTHPLKPSNKTLDLWVHLVNGCNLSCFYCYVPSLAKDVDQEKIDAHSFSEKNIVPFLSRLFEHCRTKQINVLGLKFAGGEPTVNLELLEKFCRTAVALKGDVSVQFSMISNGTNSPDHLFDLLARYRFNISFSIDGMEMRHDAVRFLQNDGVRKGTWPTAWNTILRCQASGLKPYLLYTVTVQNAEDLVPFSQLCQSEGIGFRLSLIRLSVAPKARTVDLLSESLISLYKMLGERQPTHMPIERFAKFAEWNLKKPKTLACSSGRGYFAVDQAGNLSTCQMTIGKSYGNMINEDLATVLQRMADDPSVDALTKPSARQGACIRCEFRSVCAGGCPQHTKLVSNTFHAPSPWCRVYGTLLPHYVESVARQMLRRFTETQSAVSRAGKPSN